MDLIGCFAAVLIGVSLGLIGGGGSILTVPVLVYLFRIEPVLATAYSLAIVGSTSLVGAIPKFRQGMVNLKTALIFGAPAIASVYFTRKFLVPAIPVEIFSIGNFMVTRSILMMVLFAVLMLFASISMIREKSSTVEDSQEIKYNYAMVLVEGTVVGILTGLVGAGGGFLIIPALVLFSRLPMKQAVGTSLLIIAAKSLIGFTGDLGHMTVNWSFLLLITSLAIIGIFIGNYMSHKIESDKLKKGFGWFVLVMGIYIIMKEIFL